MSDDKKKDEAKSAAQATPYKGAQQTGAPAKDASKSEASENKKA